MLKKLFILVLLVIISWGIWARQIYRQKCLYLVLFVNSNGRYPGRKQ